MNLARICERYGGGGHARVGAISFNVDQHAAAIKASQEIVEELRAAIRQKEGIKSSAGILPGVVAASCRHNPSTAPAPRSPNRLPQFHPPMNESPPSGRCKMTSVRSYCHWVQR